MAATLTRLCHLKKYIYIIHMLECLHENTCNVLSVIKCFFFKYPHTFGVDSENIVNLEIEGVSVCSRTSA